MMSDDTGRHRAGGGSSEPPPWQAPSYRHEEPAYQPQESAYPPPHGTGQPFGQPTGQPTGHPGEPMGGGQPGTGPYPPPPGGYPSAPGSAATQWNPSPYPPPGGYSAPGNAGNAGYPQPGSGPSPYPSYPAYPSAAPGYPADSAQVWSPQSAPRRRTRIFLIAALAGGLAVAVLTGVVIWATVGSGSSSASSNTPIALPSTFDGYTQLHNDMSQRVESAIRDFAKNSGAGSLLGSDAVIGSYSHNTGDQPVLVTVVIPASAARSAGAGSTADLVTGMMRGTGAVTHSYSPGSHGGTLSCGVATFGPAKETVCGWGDSGLAGIIYSINEGKTPDQMAEVARQFRDSVE